MTLHIPWHLLGRLILIVGVCSGSPPQPPPSPSCPPGLPNTPALTQRGSRCYLFINNERTWNDARSDCHSKGGYLAEIPDQATQDFLVGAIHSQGWNRNGVWIGATDNDKEGTWIWDSGRQMTYRNWAPGQEGGHSGWLFGPNHELPPNEMEDCALLRLSDGNRWHDFPCDLRLFSYAYVCQFGSSSNTCPQHIVSNYPAKQRGQLCYMFFDTLRTWTGARDDCHSKGGYLVEVMNQDTQHFLATTLRSLQWTGRVVWLGGKKNNSSHGSWVWDTGNSFRYSNWARGQNAPASAFDPYRNLARCVQLRLGPMAHWFSNPCDVVQYEASYVCQFGVSRRSTTRRTTARPTTTRRPASASTTRAAATTATTKSTASTIRTSGSPTTSYALNTTCPRYLSDVYPARQLGPVCYLFVHRLKTWKLARDACYTMGGYLVEVPDNITQQFLASSLRSLNWNPNEVWIGGTDSNGRGAWLWDSGKSFVYTNWAPGQSSHDSRVGPDGVNDKCVTLRLPDSGRWHSYRCDNVLVQYYYVCQIGTPHSSPTARLTTARPTTGRPPSTASTTPAAMTRTTTTLTRTTTRMRTPTTGSLTTVSARNTTCPRYLSDVYQARQFGPVCYLFVQRLKTWKLARDACHTMGGYLVEVLDNSTQQFFVSQLRSLNWNLNEVWIGGTDSNGHGAWLWDSGKTLGYTNWAPGQSSHDSMVGPQEANDKCVTLRLADSGRWHSYRCDNVLAQYYYVCQIGLLPTTSSPTPRSTRTTSTKVTPPPPTTRPSTTTSKRTSPTTHARTTTKMTTARQTTVVPTTTRRTTPRATLTTTRRRVSTTRRPTTTTSRRSSPTTTKGRTTLRPVATTTAVRRTTTKAMTTSSRTTMKTTTAFTPSRARVPSPSTVTSTSTAAAKSSSSEAAKTPGNSSSQQYRSTTPHPAGVTTRTAQVNLNVSEMARGSTPPRPQSAGPPKPGGTIPHGAGVVAGGGTQRYRNEPEGKDKEIDQGAVAGIIIGSIAGIVVIGLIVALVYKSRHRWPKHLYSDQDVAFENFGYGTTVHFKPNQDNAVQLCDGSKDLPESQS